MHDGTMEAAPPDPAAPPVSVGSDRLYRREGQILVVSSADMRDWEVRRYRRTMIRIGEEAFFLSSRIVQGDGAHRYLLARWPDDYADPPWKVITYDLDYVRTRDTAEETIRRHRRNLPFVAILVPVVGFLPASVKALWHERYGIDPRTATAFSLYVEYLATLGCIALLAMHMFTAAFNSKWLIGTIVVLGADAWVRKASLLDEVVNPPGFYEWLYRLRLK